jgi:hypothetical protein
LRLADKSEIDAVLGYAKVSVGTGVTKHDKLLLDKLARNKGDVGSNTT